MTEHRHYSGPDLAPLLRQVRDELGSAAEIIRAERIRSGGLAGFFAREHYEVVATRPKAELAGPVSTAATSTQASASSPPSAPDPVATEPVASAGGTGRSIQAALLDRADRVSTEELLVRVAETHSAEWGSESFQSILGRAMVDAVGPSVDVASIDERRRDGAQIDLGPNRSDKTIDGLQLESIQPGENVIDPVPQPPPVEAAADDGGDLQAGRDGDPEHSIAPAADDDSWEDGAHGPVPPPWANGVQPPWGQPWMQGWAPWMIHPWPAQAPGDPTSGAALHRLCAKCAEPIPADGHDDSSIPPTLDGGATVKPDGAASWSKLREEIDDVRLRLDDIVVTIGQVSGDGTSDGDPTSDENGLDDDRKPNVEEGRTTPQAEPGGGSGDRRHPVSARSEPEPGQYGPDRRARNNRRSGRTGR